jgi:hypothetical protein
LALKLIIFDIRWLNNYADQFVNYNISKTYLGIFFRIKKLRRICRTT